MRFSPADANSAVQLLLSAVGRTEAELGCQACTVARDAADENRVRYSETWDSEAAFQRHVQSEEFRRVLVAMDMCCEEPQVVVGNLSGQRGMTHLQELRTKDGSRSTSHD
jgi:quinol monooxygenase YgiN